MAANEPFGTFLKCVRKLVTSPCHRSLADRELLRRFADHRDEAAFAELLHRHGAMVLGVCQRLLRHSEEAEDAFQATFLTLAQKAGSIRKHDSVASWLYGVARWVSLRARTAAARRRVYEGRVPDRSPPDPLAEISMREAQAVLDEELERLPPKWRAPLVLCYLEGKTRDEAAQQLGWSPATLKRRLEEGRGALARRLAARGLTLSAGLTTTLLGPGSAPAAVPAVLAQNTLQSAVSFAAGRVLPEGTSAAVAALVKGAPPGTVATKLKATALVLLFGLVAAGAGMLTPPPPPEKPAEPQKHEQPKEPQRPVEGKEFLLKYRLQAELTDEIANGGQRLKLSDKPLRWQATPPFRSRQPLSATVYLGANGEAFPLVLDSSRNGGPDYDVLYLDADRDGRLTSEEKLVGRSKGYYTLFGPVQLAIDCGGDRCKQHYLFYLGPMEPGENPTKARLEAINAGFYQGQVTFGAERRLLAVVDYNSNGRYDDFLQEGSWAADRLLIDRDGDGRLNAHYQSDEGQPLSRCVEAGGRYWNLAVAPDGSSVTVEPSRQPLGSLRVEARDGTLLLRGEDGLLRVIVRKGVAQVPAGKYRFRQGSYRGPKDSEYPYHLDAHAPGQGIPVEVPAGGEASLPIGPPLVPKVRVKHKDGELVLNLELRGAGGEVYSRVTQNGADPPSYPVKAEIRDAAGRKLAVLDFHYG